MTIIKVDRSRLRSLVKKWAYWDWIKDDLDKDIDEITIEESR